MATIIKLERAHGVIIEAQRPPQIGGFFIALEHVVAGFSPRSGRGRRRRDAG